MVTTADQTRKQFRFPNLDVSINIRLCNGRPAHVDVRYPNELFQSKFDRSRWACLDLNQYSADEVSSRKHDICNRLHIAGMALEILGRPSNSDDQADPDDQRALEQLLEMAIESLTTLEALFG